MDIPAQLEIGLEVKIEYIGNIIINPRAKIGKNCTIFYGMLIGQQNCRKNNGILKIGDKVWIGVGNVAIGNNALIAPDTYINFEISDNSICFR